MSKVRDEKRTLLMDLKKGRMDVERVSGKFKYELSKSEREYLLSKLPKNILNEAYQYPLPKKDNELCRNHGAFYSESTILTEIKWYVDVIDHYSESINQFLLINDKIENAILNSNIEESYNLLDELDQKVCKSLYGLLTEMYLNVLEATPDNNKELIDELANEKCDAHLIIPLVFGQQRVNFNNATWKYDAFIDEHKKKYTKEQLPLRDFIDFKINPISYELHKESLPTILAYDSPYSIIDRYFTLKKILSNCIFERFISVSDRKELLNIAKSFSGKINDPFWEKLFLLYNPTSQITINNRTCTYNEILDYYLNGNHKMVLTRSSEILAKTPNYSELYVLFITSLIFEKVELKTYIKQETELYNILELMISVLEKNKNYQTDRDKLLSKYYSIFHFNFSNSIQEFIFNEYNIDIPLGIKYSSYLNSYPIRYNFYNLFSNTSEQAGVTMAIKDSETFNLIQSFSVLSTPYNEHDSTYFKNKLRVGYLMHIKEFKLALEVLNKFRESAQPEFVITWVIRKSIKCHMHLGEYDKAADLIVDYYFSHGVAYDHFLDFDLIEKVNDIDNKHVHKDISIPILFEIYNQPQSTKYDSLANFLVSFNFLKPTDLLKIKDSFSPEKFIYFLEKVCQKETMEDSPFLNSIEMLEEERIKILNYLKEVNSSKSETYDDEILRITKESSIRKGLLHIHESRIYIDTDNISKLLETALLEIFLRYLELEDITQLDLTALKLDEKYDPKKVNLSFYFTEPIDETLLKTIIESRKVVTGPKVVIVPHSRYALFTVMFDTYTKYFVFNEDYGFKSFLSMRIRHGTFSNVLRSIFDKHKIISAKEKNSQSYQAIKFWDTKLSINESEMIVLQEFLKKFSEDVDNLIDEGLTWIKVFENDKSTPGAIFNFNFSDMEIKLIYHNKIGKITNYVEFIDAILDALYDKLEQKLVLLREKISYDLLPKFISCINDLQKNIEEIGMDSSEFHIIDQEIISCRTDIQVAIEKIVNWFKVSKNHYIEEFPIDLILQTSLSFINNSSQITIKESSTTIQNTCNLKFKGQYFEAFGDIFINIFHNIIENNKDLEDALKVTIQIKNDEDTMEIKVRNNLSNSIVLEELNATVKEITEKIDNYKKGSGSVSFEKKSGYLKICKSISNDLNRLEYSVVPECGKDFFEVTIKFNYKKLTS